MKNAGFRRHRQSDITPSQVRFESVSLPQSCLGDLGHWLLGIQGGCLGGFSAKEGKSLKSFKSSQLLIKSLLVQVFRLADFQGFCLWFYALKVQSAYKDNPQACPCKRILLYFVYLSLGRKKNCPTYKKDSCLKVLGMTIYIYKSSVRPSVCPSVCLLPFLAKTTRDIDLGPLLSDPKFIWE